MKSKPLHDKQVVLAVGGGIAAYKAVELCRLLTTEGARVRVAMTESAQQFVGAMTFQALSGNAVFTDLFDRSQESEIGHIQIADSADLIIVAPATANLIGKMAAGLAVDTVSAAVLAAQAPILVAPAMNVNMWNNPAVQANVDRLLARSSISIVGPGEGFLACRWIGPGRLAEPSEIVEAAQNVLTAKDLAGRSLLISAGPTREAIDPVRFLSNRSTGRMGYALARAAIRRGATVALVSGPTALTPPAGVALTRVQTAEEMHTAVMDASEGPDALIMAAAVADFRPRTHSAGKLKKDSLAKGGAVLPLERTRDILAELGSASSPRRPLLVGFAAETDDAEANGMAKLRAKGCDLVVANDVSSTDAGFEVDTNRVILCDRNGAVPCELASKDEVAHIILDRVVSMLADRPRA